MSENPTIWMVGDHNVPLLAPTPDEISVLGLSEGLSKQSRWGGQTPGVLFNVAQHSRLVFDILADKSPRIRLAGLLHDGHEAIIGDIPTPMKRLINQAAGYDIIKRVVRPLDEAIFAACGLTVPLTDDEAHWVHWAGQQALRLEAHLLMGDSSLRDRYGMPDIDAPYPLEVNVPWQTSHLMFLSTLVEFADHHGFIGPAIDDARSWLTSSACIDMSKAS